VMDVVSSERSISVVVEASQTSVYQHWVMDVVSYRRSISAVVEASQMSVYQHWVMDVVSSKRSISVVARAIKVICLSALGHGCHQLQTTNLAVSSIL
jgi:hypothetical protein